MMRVYGYSDDLIYMEQENNLLTLNKEISVNSYSNKTIEIYITFVDGTKILMYYGDDGNWRIIVIAEGNNFIEVESYEERNSYSDMLWMIPFIRNDFYEVEQKIIK